MFKFLNKRVNPCQCESSSRVPSSLRSCQNSASLHNDDSNSNKWKPVTSITLLHRNLLMAPYAYVGISPDARCCLFPAPSTVSHLALCLSEAAGLVHPYAPHLSHAHAHLQGHLQVYSTAGGSAVMCCCIRQTQSQPVGWGRTAGSGGSDGMILLQLGGGWLKAAGGLAAVLSDLGLHAGSAGNLRPRQKVGACNLLAVSCWQVLVTRQSPKKVADLPLCRPQVSTRDLGLPCLLKRDAPWSRVTHLQPTNISEAGDETCISAARHASWMDSNLHYGIKVLRECQMYINGIGEFEVSIKASAWLDDCYRALEISCNCKINRFWQDSKFASTISHTMITCTYYSMVRCKCWPHGPCMEPVGCLGRHMNM